jgi:hypothetical protein
VEVVFKEEGCAQGADKRGLEVGRDAMEAGKEKEVLSHLQKG